MAIWQFDMTLCSLDSDANYSDKFNESHCLPGLGIISNLLGPNITQVDSWAKDLYLWGEEDSNRIEVFVEHGQTVEFNARVDLRLEFDSFLSLLFDISTAFECKWVSVESRHAFLSVSDFYNDFMNSSAYRFVNNPSLFITLLNNRNDEVS